MNEDVFILDNDQPATCPYCGARTEFEDYHNADLGDYQLHHCVNNNCINNFIGVFE